MATNIFPLDYTTKATPDATDVVWSSDGVTNFNLTIASIALYALTNNTTDSLSEGVSNLYYTTDRVETDTQNKADKDNVLELDNTTPYTPTLDYHPVTVKYLSDNMNIPDATNTTAGKIRIATDTESETGTDETIAINAKQLKDYSLQGVDTYSTIFSFSDDGAYDSGTLPTTTAGFLLVYFTENAGGISGTVRGEIFINSVKVCESGASNSDTIGEHAITIPVKSGDTWQITGSTTNGSGVFVRWFPLT